MLFTSSSSCTASCRPSTTYCAEHYSPSAYNYAHWFSICRWCKSLEPDEETRNARHPNPNFARLHSEYGQPRLSILRRLSSSCCMLRNWCMRCTGLSIRSQHRLNDQHRHEMIGHQVTTINLPFKYGKITRKTTITFIIGAWTSIVKADVVTSRSTRMSPVPHQSRDLKLACTG